MSTLDNNQASEPAPHGAPAEGGSLQEIPVPSLSWICVTWLAWELWNYDIQDIIEKWKAIANKVFQDKEATIMFRALPTYGILISPSNKNMEQLIEGIEQINSKEILKEEEYKMFLFFFGFITRNPQLVRDVIRRVRPGCVLRLSVEVRENPPSWPLNNRAGLYDKQPRLYELLVMALHLALQGDGDSGLVGILAECGMLFNYAHLYKPVSDPEKEKQVSLQTKGIMFDIQSLQRVCHWLPVLFSNWFSRTLYIRQMTAEGVDSCIRKLQQISLGTSSHARLTRQTLLRFLVNQAVAGGKVRLLVNQAVAGGTATNEMQPPFQCSNPFLTLYMKEMSSSFTFKTFRDYCTLLVKDVPSFLDNHKAWVGLAGLQYLCTEVLQTLCLYLHDVQQLPPGRPLTYEGLVQVDHLQWFPSQWMLVYKLLIKYNGESPVLAQVFWDWALMKEIFSFIQVRPQALEDGNNQIVMSDSDSLETDSDSDSDY